MVTAVEGEFYFYNPGWWPVDEAYQAFAPKLRDCVNDLAEIGTLAGRVWIVGENGRYSIYDGLQSAFGGLREIARGEVVQPYHDIEFDWPSTRSTRRKQASVHACTFCLYGSRWQKNISVVFLPDFCAEKKPFDFMYGGKEDFT